MKKRIRFATTIIAIVICIIMFILCPNIECNGDNEFLTEWEELKVSHSVSTWEYDECSESENETSIEQLAIIMSDDIANISYNYNDPNQRMDWFKEYKEVIKKYPKELHSMTIYEKYSEEELDLLFKIIQSEVGDYGFEETANVTSVIFNRCALWGRTLIEVLTEEGQFSVYSSGIYKNAVVDEETILACEYVFIFGDTTFGCIAFRSHRSCPEKWHTWGENYWTKQFSDAAHCFYK